MHAPARSTLNAVVSGSVASLLSALAMTLRGRRESGAPAAPINAVSHWVHGDRAYRVDRADLRHSAVGYLVHHASAIFWGVLYELLLQRLIDSRDRSLTAASRRQRGSAAPSGPRRPALPSAGEVLVGAAAVTGLAALTDLRLVPPRFSPGFEQRLGATSLVLVYLAFGAGLALATSGLRSVDRLRRP
jgi:hypothetical protein